MADFDRILRRRDVEAASGYCERQLRRLEQAGRFPRRFQLDSEGRAVGWLESEVRAWLESRARERGQGA